MNRSSMSRGSWPVPAILWLVVNPTSDLGKPNDGSKPAVMRSPSRAARLSADGATSLSLGGEARVTYERFGNQNFGLTQPDPDGGSFCPVLKTAPIRCLAAVWWSAQSTLTEGVRETTLPVSSW